MTMLDLDIITIEELCGSRIANQVRRLRDTLAAVEAFTDDLDRYADTSTTKRIALQLRTRLTAPPPLPKGHAVTTREQMAKHRATHPDQGVRDRLYSQCVWAAMRRVRDLHRDEYELFLAEERRAVQIHRVADADIAARHAEHYRSCNCLGDSAFCCQPSCPCHAEEVQP